MHIRSGLAVFALIAATAGCGLDKQSAPDLAGPSEFGTSITLTATPDTLPRDGESQSVITLTARNAERNPIPNLTLSLGANAGQLSASQVTTGASGTATFVFTAPPLQETVDSVVISVVPVG